MHFDDLYSQYRVELFDRAGEIDPGDSQDWDSMAVGWAVAKGLEPEDAIEFAMSARRKDFS